MLTVTRNSMKTRGYQYVGRVLRTGEEIVVTDNKVPVAKIVPVKSGLSPDVLFAEARKKAWCKTDLTAPTASEWSEV